MDHAEGELPPLGVEYGSQSVWLQDLDMRDRLAHVTWLGRDDGRNGEDQDVPRKPPAELEESCPLAARVSEGQQCLESRPVLS